MKKVGIVILSLVGVFVCLIVFSTVILDNTPLGEVVEGLAKLKNVQRR